MRLAGQATRLRLRARPLHRQEEPDRGAGRRSSTPQTRRRSTVREDDQGLDVRLGHLALLDREAARRGARRPLPRRRAATSSACAAARRGRARAARRRRRGSAPGDEVEVQLSLRAAARGRVRAPARPAAGGPRARASRPRAASWDLGLGCYEEIARQRHQLLLRVAAGGRVHLRYRLRANLAGTFRVGPATVQSMYAPEFTAYSAGEMLRVEGK